MKLMMKKKLLVAIMFILGVTFSANAQTAATPAPKPNNSIAHKVAMGETVMMVARKYRITPQDIYDLNPDAVNGISAATMLNIPAMKKLSHKPKDSHRDIDDVKLYMDANRVVAKQE